MPDTMQAVLWNGPHDLVSSEVPTPEVPEGWALVRPELCGICGTDLAIFAGKHPRAQAGLIPGHEIVGTVIEAGASGPAAGARVAVEPLISCGECRACRTGNSHVCASLGLYGIDAPGGLAELVALPPERLFAIPADVPIAEAALVEPLAVAVHAVRRAGVAVGDVVAVAGAGPIGVLTALVARHSGARAVVITDPTPERRAIAHDYGFTVAADDDEFAALIAGASGGEGADVFFDSAGHPAVAARFTSLTRVLGTIAIVGVYKQPAAVDLRDVCFLEHTVVGMRVYTSQDIATAVALVAAGTLGLDRFPTATFPTSRIDEAAEAAADGRSALKVFIDPRPEAVA